MLVSPKCCVSFVFWFTSAVIYILPKLNLESLICACLSSFMLYEQGKTSCSLNMTSVIFFIFSYFCHNKRFLDVFSIDTHVETDYVLEELFEMCNLSVDICTM